MPYTRNTWVNNTTPAISAVNLNRLTNELKSQATARSVAHTLPTWADGTAPAVSDQVPLDEMERVLAAVATSLGLSYTVTNWSDGWVPARNAANLNKMEVQAVANRNAIDQAVAGSPLGYILFSFPQRFPQTNSDKYGLVIHTHPPQAGNTVPANFTGLYMRYRSLITCQPAGDLNITDTECLDNGWEMRTSGGALLTNVLYSPSVLGDPGNSGYQLRWCQATLAKLQEHAAFGGFWADDASPSIWAITGDPAAYTNPRPAAYPNDTAYENALLSFATFAQNYFQSRGYKTAYNNVVVLDNTGSQTVTWYNRIAPLVDYCAAEYWMTPPNRTTPRTMGTEWFQAWDGWRAIHGACQAAGCGFQPLSSNASAQVYALATFLLDWNGNGYYTWAPAAGYGSQADIWISQYAIAANLGAPSGAAVLTGSTWTRQFANGSVSVNPFNGTASIT